MLMRNSLLKGKAGERVYPRVINYDNVSAERFVAGVAERRQLTRGEIKAVLSGVADELAMQICNGHTVTIDGLGTFSVSMKGSAVEDSRGVLQLGEGLVRKVNFIPSKQLKSKLDEARFSLVSHEVSDAARVDDAMAVEAAQALTERQGSFMRSDFAKAAGLSYSYAGRVLARLAEEGRVVCTNVGRTKLYRAASVNG